MHTLHKSTVILIACLLSQTSQADSSKATPKSQGETSSIKLVLGEVLTLLTSDGKKYLIEPSKGEKTPPGIGKDQSTPAPKPEEPPIINICCPGKKLLPNDSDTQSSMQSLLNFIQRIFSGLMQPKSFMPSTSGSSSNSTTQDPWQLRVSEDQEFCYAPNQSITLLLPESKIDKDGQSAKGGFARITDSFWYVSQDALMVIKDEAKKKEAAELMTKPKNDSHITLHQMPANLSTDKAKADWMREHHCERQAGLLSGK